MWHVHTLNTKHSMQCCAAELMPSSDAGIYLGLRLRKQAIEQNEQSVHD